MTSEILRIKPAYDGNILLEDDRTINVGRFIRFDTVKRILYTEKDIHIYLPIADAEKTRSLKDATKQWLLTLSI